MRKDASGQAPAHADRARAVRTGGIVAVSAAAGGSLPSGGRAMPRANRATGSQGRVPGPLAPSTAAASSVLGKGGTGAASALAPDAKRPRWANRTGGQPRTPHPGHRRAPAPLAGQGEEQDTSQTAKKDKRPPRGHARVPLDQIDVHDARFVAMRRKIGKILAQLGPLGKTEGGIEVADDKAVLMCADIETELRKLSVELHADTVDLLLAGESRSALVAPRAAAAKQRFTCTDTQLKQRVYNNTPSKCAPPSSGAAYTRYPTCARNTPVVAA